jgi:hypothetical protein
MIDLDIKLHRAKPVLLFVGIATLAVVAFTVDTKAPTVIYHQKSQGKSLEEIMHGPVPTTIEPAWDTEFKSSIIEETK